MRRSVKFFKALFNGRLLAWNVHKDDLKKSLEMHWAYGVPSEDEDNYSLGNNWAENEDDEGWFIVEDCVDALMVRCDDVSFADEYECQEGHLHWTCPVCGNEQSEDFEQPVNWPHFTSCGIRDCGFLLLTRGECPS
jgi:hypothetical protein